MSLHSTFLQTLNQRGFIHQQTDAAGLDALLAAKAPVPAYIGFDCTADSLHVGSLMQIMALRWLQKSGHKPIVLLGGGTTKIGDPSGKDKSREMLTPERIEQNKQGIARVFAKFLEFEQVFDPATTNAVIVDNAEWLEKLNYIEMLRDIGPHFSINRMLTMDSVKQRLEREQHLSFLEFNYMILQAYDFTVLAEKYGCRLQIGGSDQWGNITQGTELQRHLNAAHERKAADLFGLTTPLLTTASGAKMGKTADGAVWLNAERLSPYDYWQFWRNTEDADVGRFLRFFTELPLDEIARLEALEGAGINEAKKRLADEATTLAHGAEAAARARQTAEQTFEQGGLSENLPSLTLPAAQLAGGIPAYQLFLQAGLAASGGEARKLIRGGGARANDVKIEDENALLSCQPGEKLKLSAGKKKHLLVQAA